MTSMADVRAAQPEWFSRKNMRFFGDVSYKLLHGKQSRRPYLVRATYMWSDMFNQPKTLRYRLNELNNDLTVGKLVDKQFSSIEAVKDWLRTA